MDQANAAIALTALAHEHRLSIFRCLIRCGPRGLSAGEIAKSVGISPTNLSFHLKELGNARLLRSWREGRFVRYAVEIDAMRCLIEFLTQDCCDGHPELCGSDLVNAARMCDGESIEIRSLVVEEEADDGQNL